MDISSEVVLWCPMAPAIHPAWRIWESETVAWMERFGLDGEQREAGRLRCITAGELAGRTLPDCTDPPGAVFSTKSLMWLFAFDDAYCDEGRYSHDPGEMAVLVAEMNRIAETGRTGSSSPCARALADLRCQLDVLAGPVAIARWVGSMKAYLGYQVWEAAHRSMRIMPTIDQYAVARIRNGSMEVCAMSLDIAGGYEVPAREMDSLDIRALTEIACCLVGLDNDVASYHKEHTRSGDRINLVDVIAHERDRTPDEALPEAVGFRDAVLTLYLQLSEQVRPTAGPATRRYLDGLSAWIRGNLDWSMHTARYQRADRATIRVTNQPRRTPIAGFTSPAGVAWWWSRLKPAAPRIRTVRLPRRSARAAHFCFAKPPGAPGALA
jgi:Terpene synthase family 2, C-terminal metal binding